jgi:hypothetical protein
VIERPNPVYKICRLIVISCAFRIVSGRSIMPGKSA